MSEPKYTIGVVAEMLSITPQTIRVYEERGFIRPVRSSGNTRLYSDTDVDTLKMVLKLTQEMRVNLAGVEIIIKLIRQIQDLELEREKLYQMLYEAGEILQGYMESSPGKSVPMRSTMGTLIQVITREY